MDIKNLLTFIQVAELNSFTKASQILGYSQSTVSSQIKQLETELNCQLFERIYHTIALTDKGREVLKYAHQMTKLTQELENSIQDTSSIHGHVRLALADSLSYSLLKDKFAEFMKMYPHITLKMIPAGTEELFRLLNHNEVDMILTLDSHIYDTDYIIVKEEKIAVRFVVSVNHELAQKDTMTIQQLIQYPFILTEKGMSYRRIFDEMLAEKSLEVQPVLELGSTHLICSLVEQGVGISLLPEYVTQQSVIDGKLKYLHVEGFDMSVWKQLLYHRDKWVSPQMEIIMQYL
ncbi:MAG: LysR family transcriptional regulator [Erysipelotrichales bacterium]|nr:LysR family transcriptional regulator [Erysipelotrichales bacterium]